MRPHRRSPPGSPIPGILQTRTLEWVAISFSNAWKWKVKVKSLSRVRLFETPWTAAYQAAWDFPGKSAGVGCHCLLQAWVEGDAILTYDTNGHWAIYYRAFHWLIWREKKIPHYQLFKSWLQIPKYLSVLWKSWNIFFFLTQESRPFQQNSFTTLCSHPIDYARQSVYNQILPCCYFSQRNFLWGTFSYFLYLQDPD